MRHLIGIGFVVCAIFAGMVPNTVQAGHNRGRYINGGCAVFVHCNWCTTDHFYYCTDNMEKKSDCDGRKFNHSDSVKGRHRNGEKFVWDGKQYYCYIKPGETDGTYIRSDAESFYKGEPRTRKKNLPDGGFCNETIQDTIVENDTLIKPCNEQEECPDGTILRTMRKNGAPVKNCVTPCTGGKVFESLESTNCVECPNTQYQGRVSVVSKITKDGDTDVLSSVTIGNNDGGSNTEEANTLTADDVCIKCDSASSFFDAKQKKCVLKSDFEFAKGKDAMKKCWQCAAKGTGAGEKGSPEKPVNLFEECIKKDAPDDYVNKHCSFWNKSSSGSGAN